MYTTHMTSSPDAQNHTVASILQGHWRIHKHHYLHRTMAKPYNLPDLKELIQSADAGLLRIFLWKHLKRNNQSSIRLRAFLIDTTDSPPGTNKYAAVLGLLVAHDIHGTIRLTRRSIQLLRDVCSHFTDVQEQSLQSGALRDAWEAGWAVCSHLHVYLDRQAAADPDLVAVLSRAYQLLEQCFALFPAPELRRDIYTSMHDLIARRHYRLYDIRHNAVTLLLLAAADADDRAQVHETIAAHARRHDDTDYRQRILWYAMMYIADGDVALVSPEPELCYDIVQLLHGLQHHTAMDRLLRQCPDPVLQTPAQQRQWARWQFDFALRSGEQSLILRHGLALLSRDHDLQTYRRLRTAVTGEIDLSPVHLPVDLVGAIYANDKNWSDLARLIADTGAMHLLIRFAEDLLAHMENAAHYLITTVTVYVENHGGTQCIDLVMQLRDRLRALGKGDVAAQLMHHLNTEFPDRFDGVAIPGAGR